MVHRELTASANKDILRMGILIGTHVYGTSTRRNTYYSYEWGCLGIYLQHNKHPAHLYSKQNGTYASSRYCISSSDNAFPTPTIFSSSLLMEEIPTIGLTTLDETQAKAT